MLRQLNRDIVADLRRYRHGNGSPVLAIVLSCQGFWILLQYRISRWVRYHFHVPVLRPCLRLVCAVWRKLIELTTGCEFPNSAEIGLGILMPHANGIIVHMDARIGHYCNLGQQVTIGGGEIAGSWGAPTLGDRVFVGPGAKILGPVTIGSEAVVGANAVVIRDLPDKVLAVGVPAVIKGHGGSDRLIGYPRISGT